MTNLAFYAQTVPRGGNDEAGKSGANGCRNQKAFKSTKIDFDTGVPFNLTDTICGHEAIQHNAPRLM